MKTFRKWLEVASNRAKDVTLDLVDNDDDPSPMMDNFKTGEIVQTKRGQGEIEAIVGGFAHIRYPGKKSVIAYPTNQIRKI